MLSANKRNRGTISILLLVVWGLSSLYLAGFHHHDADDCHEQECPCAVAVLASSDVPPSPTVASAPSLPLLVLPDYEAPAFSAETTCLVRLRGPPLSPATC